MAKQSVEKANESKEVEYSILELAAEMEVLNALKEKAISFAAKHKSELVDNTLIGFNHSIELTQSEFAKFQLEIEKIISLEEAKKENN